MSRPLHPVGFHLLRLVQVKESKYGPLLAQCIFEGVGENKRSMTLSRLISRHGRWADTSAGLLLQLKIKDPKQDLVDELSGNIGQEFLCDITRQGSGFQMNITRFLPTNINSKSHVFDEPLSGESHVG